MGPIGESKIMFKFSLCISISVCALLGTALLLVASGEGPAAAPELRRRLLFWGNSSEPKEKGGLFSWFRKKEPKKEAPSNWILWVGLAVIVLVGVCLALFCYCRSRKGSEDDDEDLENSSTGKSKASKGRKCKTASKRKLRDGYHNDMVTKDDVKNND